MNLAQNLIAPFVLALLAICLWESRKNIIKKIKKIFAPQFPNSSYKTQNKKSHLIFEKQRVLNDIKKEASTIMGQGHCVSMLIKDRILKETRQEAAAILQEAKNDIEKVRRETLDIFQQEMVDMAISITRQIQNDFISYVQGPCKPHQRIINKYLDNHPYQSNNASLINKVL